MTVKSILVEAIEQAEASITNEEWHKQVVEAKSLLLGAGLAILTFQASIGGISGCGGLELRMGGLTEIMN